MRASGFAGLLAMLTIGGACSMIFWRPAAPLRSAVWFDSRAGEPGAATRVDRFLELATHYQERSPLDPLAGTTRKRNYRARLTLLEIAIDPAGTAGIPGEQAWFEFPGWVLEDSLFRGPGDRPSLWFIGGENDDYAGPRRGLFFADALGRVRAVNLSAAHEGAAAEDQEAAPADAASSTDLLLRAVPSPSRRLLALLEDQSKSADDGPAHRLRIVDPLLAGPGPADGEANPVGAGVSLSLRIRASFASPEAILDGPRWSPDDSGVYYQTATGVYFLNAFASGGSPAGVSALQLARRYPACLTPATASGGAFSPGGRRLYFDDALAAYQLVTEAPGEFPAFKATPWRFADGSVQDLDCP